MNKNSTNWVGIGLAFTICALVFGLLGGIASRYFGPEARTLTYAEFVSILLSAISVLLTILGIIIAIVALFGWKAISAKVESRADDALIKYLQNDMKPTDKVFQELFKKLELAMSISKDEEDMLLEETINKSDKNNDN